MADLRLVCEECEHFFDWADKRCFVSTDPDYGPLCSVCAMFKLRGDKEWAVWNDCQGIFETRVRLTEAEDLLRSEYADCDARVVPVRVYPEPEDRIEMRFWCERTHYSQIQIR